MSDIIYDEVGIMKDGQYRPGQWKEIAVHDSKNIKGFFGAYRRLSNMYLVRVYYEGDVYPSVENAYQAAKFPKEERAYFKTCSPYDAKRASIGKPMMYSKEEWDNIRKVPIMKMLLEQKFNCKMNGEFHTFLSGTKGKYLEETNWWDDTFWGCTLDGVGENYLGKLIMEIRDR